MMTPKQVDAAIEMLIAHYHHTNNIRLSDSEPRTRAYIVAQLRTIPDITEQLSRVLNTVMTA